MYIGYFDKLERDILLRFKVSILFFRSPPPFLPSPLPQKLRGNIKATALEATTLPFIEF